MVHGHLILLVYQPEGALVRTAACEGRNILDAFAGERTLTKEQLLGKLGCSWMTAWRLLTAQGYLTSYNDNARHYTLASIPRFDEHGLWRCRTARFSRYGTLIRTIVELVCRSPAGLYAEELQRRLGVNVRPTLSRLVRDSSVSRHKLAGRFLYLAMEPERSRMQLQSRSAEPTPAPDPALLPDPATIIAVLVERIRTADAGPELITRRLRRKGLSLSRAHTRAVFAHYRLTEKKGRSS